MTKEIRNILNRLLKPWPTAFPYGPKAAATIAWLLLLCSCGSGPEFRVSGVVDGLGTRNLRMVYYSNGSVQQVSSPAIDGKFAMEGRTDQPALMEIYTSSGAIVGRLIVEGGDDIRCEFSTSEPYKLKISGNDESSRLADFITVNSLALEKGDPRTINAAVERFVKDNPRRLAAAAVLAEFYHFEADPEGGRALLELFDPKAKPAALVGDIEEQLEHAARADTAIVASLRLYCPADSLTTFSPAASGHILLCFLDTEARRSDSLQSILATIAALSSPSSLKMADISLDPDTTAWLASVRRLQGANLRADSSRVEMRRLWGAGTPASPGLEELAVPSAPFFVLADSTGRVVLRTSSALEIKQRLQQPK